MPETSLWATLRPWLRLLGERRGRLLAGGGLLALTLLSATGLLALSGWFITASALTGMALAAGVAASLDVHLPGGGIRLFAVTRTVSRYLERLYNHDSVLRLLADLRRRLFAVLARLDDRTLASQRSSDWLNRLTADIDTLDGLYLRLLAPPFVALLTILTLSLFLALWLPLAGLAVALILLSAWAWLTAGQAWLGMAPSRGGVKHRQRLRDQVIEHLQGQAELEAYGSRRSHRRSLFERERRLQRDQRRLGRAAALGAALVNLGVGLAMLTALWLAAMAWQQGEIGGAVMVMVPLAVLASGEAMSLLPVAFTPLGATRAAAERLNALETAGGRFQTWGDLGLPEGALSVRLHRVSLHYPGTIRPALSGVDVTLAPGDRLVLTGASGAGKTSLAALLTRRLPPSQGTIHLGEEPLARVAEASLRERVALLGQRIDLFDDSLAMNLHLAAPDAEASALWQALEWVAMGDWARSLPQGLATRVGEGGRQLSGGQARRLALARLWLRDPGLVILDEPFASLDADTVMGLRPRLDAWLAGRTVLYLVHQLADEHFMPPGITHRAHLYEGRLVDFAHC